MSLYSHTHLMNAAIGFCKHDESWIHPLADLSYEAKLVEQKIGTEMSGKSVTPDVVATSQKLIHSVVIECKGGKSVNERQIVNYMSMKPSDLHNKWIHIYDKNQHTLDVCLLICKPYEHSWESGVDLPILSLSDRVLTLRNKFLKLELNQKFNTDISTEGFAPPISYYPFSHDADRKEIIPHALRAIRLSICKKQQNSITDPEFYVNDATMKQIHKVWDILSRKHQELLKNRVKNIIVELIKSHSKLKAFLENIQTNEKMSNTKSNSLANICSEILQKESQTTMDDFTS